MWITLLWRPSAAARGSAGRFLTRPAAAWRAGGGAFITLEVRASNQGATALYAEQGFAVAGRRRGFYTHPKEDALLMTKELLQQEPR